jgi:hypothetical protein
MELVMLGTGSPIPDPTRPEPGRCRTGCRRQGLLVPDDLDRIIVG